LRISRNLSAPFSLNRLKNNNKKVGDSIKKLSSGLRVNSASDDAAGSAISQKMRAQTGGLRQAYRNIQDGISLIQTAEGGLARVQAPPLQRLRELVIQAANDTLSDADRQLIQREIEEIKQAINEIADNTEFNRIKLLNGTNPTGDGGSSFNPGPGDVLSPAPVDPSGLFRFATTGGYPATDADDSQVLVYGQGLTSYPSVRIDGTTYYLNPASAGVVITPTEVEDGVYKTVYTINGSVEVTQSVRVAGNFNDKYEIKYSIANTGAGSQNIGIQFNIDAQLGDDDFAPFIVNGNEVTTETLYSGSNVPLAYTVYNQNSGSGANAEIQAHGTLRGSGIIEEPSGFGIGNWHHSSNIGNSVSGWNFIPTGPVGDSAFSIWWDERPVSSGGNFEVNTFYGLSVPPTIDAPADSDLPWEMTLQVGPNAGNSFKVQLSDVRTSKLGIDDISVYTQESAMSALATIDSALEYVSSERGKFGAYQNSLEHIGGNVTNYEANLTAAESRIVDVDMAAEMVQMTRNEILLKASTAVLIQANLAPQAVLSLIEGL